MSSSIITKSECLAKFIPALKEFEKATDEDVLSWHFGVEDYMYSNSREMLSQMHLFEQHQIFVDSIKEKEINNHKYVMMIISPKENNDLDINPMAFCLDFLVQGVAYLIKKEAYSQHFSDF